jgi:hypothetical protein
MAKRMAFLGDEEILENLLRLRPQDRDTLHRYVQRAKVYRNECGCAMSGVFLVAASAFLAFDFLWFRGPVHDGLILQLFAGAAFVFGSAVVGKLTGKGIARLRLALLYRDLRIRFPLEGY